MKAVIACRRRWPGGGKRFACPSCGTWIRLASPQRRSASLLQVFVIPAQRKLVLVALLMMAEWFFVLWLVTLALRHLRAPS